MSLTTTTTILTGFAYLVFNRYYNMCDHNYQDLLPYKSNDIVLDIGAYEGCSSFEACKIVKQVISIEPELSSYLKLLDKINELQINNIIPINIGVYNKKGFVAFDAKSNMGSQILSSQILIQVDTIDNILDNLNINVNFITMDIEGSEIEALQGATETLKHVNKIVIAAYHYRSDLNEKTYKYVDKFLRDNGFTTFIDNGYLVHGWK